MNDKILQLLVQSGLLINVSEYRVSELDPNIKKFAELIVKECVDVIRKEVSLKYKDGGETEEFMGGHYASSMLARVKIKHHFGVKE